MPSASSTLLVLIVFLMLVAAVLLPFLTRPHGPKRLHCINHLKQIEIGFKTWAWDNNDHYPMEVSVTNGGTMELVGSGKTYPHFQVMSNELSTTKVLLCPEDRKRTWAPDFAGGLRDINLSYFVGVDAVASPVGTNSLSLLCGDRNLTNQPLPGSKLVILTSNANFGWTKELHKRRGCVLRAGGKFYELPNGFNRGFVNGTNCLSIP